MLNPNGLALARQVNAGLLCLRRSAFDLDMIEWYLSRPRHLTKPYFTEQTAWAMLAFQKRFVMWDPRQARVIRPNERPDDSLVAGHFVFRSRHLIPVFQQHQRPADASRVEAHIVPLGRAGFIHLAAMEAARVAERLATKLKTKPK